MSAEGRLIANRYRLEKRIGSGAMGVVWRAVDERLHRTVAVKQLLLQPGFTNAETEEARQRSMREGRIAARLQHQNAIIVFDVAEDEGQPVLVMEYLPSRSLAKMLAENGPMPPREVARIGAQVAGALAAAHSAGIVHRDLKPGNVLLGEDGSAKITDFGISRAIGDVSVTKSGILAGTPAYLSPEVALGRDPSPASDVFSLGSTLYAAAEAEPPFGQDENAISLLHRVANGAPRPPQLAGPIAPALMHLLRHDPAERPRMSQVRDMLQAIAEGRPIPGSASPEWQRGAAAPPPPHPRGNPRPAPEPGTRVDAPAAAATRTSTPQRRSDRSHRRVLWTVLAVLAAALLGVLAANAFSNLGSAAASPAASAAPRSTPVPVPASPQENPGTHAASASTSHVSPSTSPASTTHGASTSVTVPARDVQKAVTSDWAPVPEDLDQA